MYLSNGVNVKYWYKYSDANGLRIMLRANIVCDTRFKWKHDDNVLLVLNQKRMPFCVCMRALCAHLVAYDHRKMITKFSTCIEVYTIASYPFHKIHFSTQKKKNAQRAHIKNQRNEYIDCVCVRECVYFFFSFFHENPFENLSAWNSICIGFGTGAENIMKMANSIASIK